MVKKDTSNIQNTQEEIGVIAQEFYGAGTMLAIIPKKKIHRFLAGWLTDTGMRNVNGKIIRVPLLDEELGDLTYTIINIPDTENLVLLYNNAKEENYKNEGMKVTVNIPELDLTLHSTCFICRQNEQTKEFESVKDGDLKIVKKYLVS